MKFSFIRKKSWVKQQSFPSSYKEHKFLGFTASVDTQRIGLEFQATRQHVLGDKDYVLSQFTLWILFFGIDLSYEIFTDVDGLIEPDRPPFEDNHYESTGFGD